MTVHNVMYFFCHRYLQQSVHDSRSEASGVEETPAHGNPMGSGTNARVCSEYTS